MANWLNVNPMSGKAREITTISLKPVDVNTGRKERTAALKFKVGNEILKEITVKQPGIEPFVSFSSTTLNIPSTGGVIDLSFETNTYALEFFFDSAHAYAINDSATKFIGKARGVYLNLSNISNLQDYLESLLETGIGDDLYNLGVQQLFIFGNPETLIANINSTRGMTDWDDVPVTTSSLVPIIYEYTLSNVTQSIIPTTNGEYQSYGFKNLELYVEPATSTSYGLFQMGAYGELEDIEPLRPNGTISIPYLVPTMTITSNAQEISADIELTGTNSKALDVESNNDWEVNASEQTQITPSVTSGSTTKTIKVIDSLDNEIIGAIVMKQGTTIGDSTDENGEVVISGVPFNPTVYTISAIGYQEKTVTIKQADNDYIIVVLLEEDELVNEKIDLNIDENLTPLP